MATSNWKPVALLTLLQLVVKLLAVTLVALKAPGAAGVGAAVGVAVAVAVGVAVAGAVGVAVAVAVAVGVAVSRLFLEIRRAAACGLSYQVPMAL